MARFRVSLQRLFASVSVCLASSGCSGVPTQGERTENARVQAVIGKFRPDGDAPRLPRLHSGASAEVFVRYAMLNHPEVEAAFYEWLAAVFGITKARSLPDPRLMFETDIARMVMSVMPGLMVDLPGPGKLGAAADAAAAESRRRYFEFEAAALRVAFNFKKALLELNLLDEKVRINRETLDLLGDLEKLSQSFNEIGKASLQDLLRTQMGKERLATEVANLQDSRQALLVQFKAALGLGASAPMPPLPAPLKQSPLSLTPNQMLATALARHPKLAAMEADVRRAEAELTLAQRSRIPDFSVGIEADVKANPLMVRPRAGMTLPVWRDKIAAEIGGGFAMKRAADAKLNRERLNLAVEVALKSYSYRESTRILSLLQTSLLPKARQALDVARSGYAAGTADFINWSDAQRTLLEFRLAEAEARMKREMALAELSLLVLGLPPHGTPLLAQ